MIDIHSHIIPGVDDGPPTMIIASQILSEASKAGVKTIIATPHYNKELHENGTVEQNFRLLQKEALQYDITIKMGYEIKIHQYAAQMPDDYYQLTLGDSRYILLELPFDKVPEYTFNLLYELQLKRLIPIMAHPERCSKLAKDKHLLSDLIETGCLFQVDAASIIGINGRTTKRFVRKIITSGKVSFAASDAHEPNGYSNWYIKAYKKVQKWIGKQKADDLFIYNPESILESIAREILV